MKVVADIIEKAEQEKITIPSVEMSVFNDIIVENDITNYRPRLKFFKPTTTTAKPTTTTPKPTTTTPEPTTEETTVPTTKPTTTTKK